MVPHRSSRERPPLAGNWPLMSHAGPLPTAPQPAPVPAPAAVPQGGVSPRTYLTAGWLTLFVIGTDLFVVSPLLPFVKDRYNVDVATAGWTVTAFALAYMVAAPWFGGLSDRH